MKNKQSDIRRFTIKFFLLFLPFVVYFGFAFYILLISGELTPINKVIKRQIISHEEIIVGFAYTGKYEYYKLRTLIERKPEIIALGTSRSTQFRSDFFKPGTNFYNAAKAITELKQLKHLIGSIPQGKKPKIIILGLDQDFFVNTAGLPEKVIKERYSDKFNLINELRDKYITVNLLYKDYFKGKFNLKDLLFKPYRNNKVGLAAIFGNGGFRNDGSYYYASDIKKIREQKNSGDYKFKNDLLSIESGCCRFQYSNDIPEENLTELKLFLEECKRNDIYVIGFLPAYAHAVYENMVNRKDNYGYLLKLKPALKPIFEGHGFAFYDFSDISSLGATDKETIDGSHCSEKTYLRLFIAICQANEKLKTYTDLNYLKMQLDSATDDFIVFKDGVE